MCGAVIRGFHHKLVAASRVERVSECMHAIAEVWRFPCGAGKLTVDSSLYVLKLAVMMLKWKTLPLRIHMGEFRARQTARSNKLLKFGQRVD